MPLDFNNELLYLAADLKSKLGGEADRLPQHPLKIILFLNPKPSKQLSAQIPLRFKNLNRSPHLIVKLCLFLLLALLTNLGLAQVSPSIQATMLPGASAHLWRLPMAAPPVITTQSSTSSAIPNSVLIPWTDPRLIYTGIATMVQAGPNYPNFFYGAATGAITGWYDVSDFNTEFDVTTNTFEILHAGGHVNLMIDGQWVPATSATFYGSPGSIEETRFSFTTSGSHRILIPNSSMFFGGIYLPPAATFSVSQPTNLTLMWVGDSFGEGTGATDGHGMNWAIAEKFGWNLCNSSQGGTGYVSEPVTVPPKYNYLDRVQNVGAVQPDILVVQGSVNDTSFVTATIAGQYFDAVAAMSPKTRIIAVAPTWIDNDSYEAVVGLSADAIQAAASARGITFIPTNTWFPAEAVSSMYQVGTAFAATASISGGMVVSATISNGGTGWCTPLFNTPATTSTSIMVTGGTSSTSATIYGIVGNYAVTYLGLLAGGSGYTTTPSVVISGGGGVGATATCSIAGGSVTGVFLSTGGTGFTGRPDVAFVGGTTVPGAGGALASAFVTGTIVTLSISSGGSGYTSPPTLSIPVDPTHPNQNGHDWYAEQFAIELQNLLNATPGIPDRYAAWQTQNFTAAQLADPTVSGPSVVLGPDHSNNLLKYALGVPAYGALPSGSQALVPVVGGGYAFSYRRPNNIQDVTYVVEISTDLNNWSSIELSNLINVSTDANGMATWEGQYLGSAPSLFFRLNVTLP